MKKLRLEPNDVSLQCKLVDNEMILFKEMLQFDQVYGARRNWVKTSTSKKKHYQQLGIESIRWFNAARIAGSALDFSIVDQCD